MTCAGADAATPAEPVDAQTRSVWESVRNDLSPQEVDDPVFPFTIEPATCAEGTWFTWLGLGSAWVDVHQTDGGQCEVWLGGETENPGYDGRPTRYCRFPSACEPLSATLGFDDGGPATIDSPYCVSPGLAPGPKCDLERAVLSACVSGPGIDEFPPFEEGYDLSVNGVVEAIGVRGDDDCFRSETARVGAWIRHQAAELDSAKWVSLRTAQGDLFHVGVITPGFAWDVGLGDDVAVDLRTKLQAFAPDQSNIEVRGPNDELIYWQGLAGSLVGLTPPAEVELADGGIECRDSNECFEERRLHRVRMTVDGHAMTVGYGASATVGALALVNGGLESQYGATDCLDAFIAWAAISAWPAMTAPLGDVAVGVTIQDGSGVAAVSYQATCGETPPISGTLEEESPGIWRGNAELPVGDCMMLLTVNDLSGEAICLGSVTFFVEAAETTEFDAVLVCGLGG